MNELDRINADVAACLGLTLCVCDLDTNAGRPSSEPCLPCNYNLWDGDSDLQAAGKGFKRPKAFWCEEPGLLWRKEHHRWDEWSPSSNIRDALDAARSAGLLANGWILAFTPQAPPELRYDFSPKLPRGVPYDPGKKSLHASTAPLAICKAIKVAAKKPTSNVRCDQCGKPLPEPTECPAVFQMGDATFCSMTCLEAYKHNQKGKPMPRPENVRCETCVFWGPTEPPQPQSGIRPDIAGAAVDRWVRNHSYCHLEPIRPNTPWHPDHYCSHHRTTWPGARRKATGGAIGGQDDDAPMRVDLDDQQKTNPGAMAPPGAFVLVMTDHGREWYRVEDGHLVTCGRPEGIGPIDTDRPTK